MKALIQITGVQYACTENDIGAVMAAMEKEKPEVLLVTEQTHDYGIIVRAVVGTAYRGVVSRFDLELVLGMMHHDGTPVLVGKVAETDLDGRCYSVILTGDYPTLCTPADATPDLWSQWRWTGAPLMDSNPDDRRLAISLKVVLAELNRCGSMNRQTLIEHLNLVTQLAKWDVSRETQEQLGRIRRLVCSHPDPEVRALAPCLRHTIAALGSKTRTRLFQDDYFPMLCRSEEAAQMQQQWHAMHKGEMTDMSLWQPTITRQLQAIDDCLMQLPAELCYQKDQFGTLMHRLLYLGIPRAKLLMLLSALVLRKQLRSLMGMADDDTSPAADEADRQLAIRLAPVFYGKTDSARNFILLARERTSTEITSLVSMWVREKQICPAHCHRPLWRALHEAGIYRASESNWNQQLCTRKGWG